MDIVFILSETVRAIHAATIERHGGAPGLRDGGLLERALARPLNLIAYGSPDICEPAASYAFGVLRDHPFVDGNKRVAFLTAALFLEVNGRILTAPEEHATAMMLTFAAGDAEEADFAAWLRRFSREAA